MEQLNEKNKSVPSGKEIGNIEINYSGQERPLEAIPIISDDKKTYLLVTIKTSLNKSKLVLQDLNGNTIKEMAVFGSAPIKITASDNCIYAFYGSENFPLLYVFDKHTFEQSYSQRITNAFSKVKCKDDRIYTFNARDGISQCRDFTGSIYYQVSIKRKNLNPAYIYFASDRFHYFDPKSLDKYREECEERFGKTIVDFNYLTGIAYDESNGTFFMAFQNIIAVIKQKEIIGTMYFPGKRILNIAIDYNINSLVITSSIQPNKTYSYDNGGSLEILPISMVYDRIKSSEEELIAKKENPQVEQKEQTYKADNENKKIHEETPAESNEPYPDQARLDLSNLTRENFALTMAGNDEGGILPGAFGLAKEIPEDDYFLFLGLDFYGIRHQKLWRLYHFCCKDDYKRLLLTTYMIGKWCFSQKDIDDNLMLEFFIPFIDDEIYEKYNKEGFGPGDIAWRDFEKESIAVFKQKIKEKREEFTEDGGPFAMR